MRRSAWLVMLLAGLAGLGAGACFDPLKPACAFACGPGGACPDEYTCGADDLCHRTDGVGQCTLSSPQDGGNDGQDAAAD